MLPLGLTSAELKLFNQSLSTHHSVKITVQMLTLGHDYLADLSSRLLDGQVTIDATAEVWRSLTMQLNDPEQTLQLDSTAPSDGALYYDRMIRVVYSVKSELLPRWVDVPIFCGPITKMKRNADIVDLEAQGKEKLLIPPAVAWKSKTWAKGVNRASLVRALLANYGGETKFSIPHYTALTPGPVSMTYTSNVWQLAKAVNGSFGSRFIFYDGRGALVMRNTPRTGVWTFKTGNGGNVVTQPDITYDIDAVRNVVHVKGAIPKGKKTPVQATYAMPKTHTLSPWRLGRNGVPRALLHEVTDDNMKTVGQCRALAKRTAESLALQAIDVSFTALVVPHLEPYDIFTLKTPDAVVSSRYLQATIPLKSAVGTVGFLARRNPNKARIRNR